MTVFNGRGPWTLALSLALVGCSGTDPAGETGAGGATQGNGSGGTNAGGRGPGGGSASGGARPDGKGGGIAPTADPLRLAKLKESADAASKLDAAGARGAYPTKFTAKLDYDPLAAEYLDRVQASAFALSDGEKAALSRNGFVISTRREFPTFLYGLAQIYSEHLPVYVSADAILESVHSSYDTILLNLERGSLIADVQSLLEGMRGRLAASAASKSVKADTDLYLAVAMELLGTPAPPVAGADGTKVRDLVAQATAGSGTGELELFGGKRQEDWSQFTPRGHYAGDPQLEAYFRAMMWLGRVDLRLVETASDGSQAFHREQYDAMLALNDLVGPDLAKWQQVDDALRTFVGPSDNMVVPQVAQLVADLGGRDAADKASDDAIVKALVAGGYGEQEIASYLMVNDGTVQTLPLNRSFLLFGQRYVVDSHVFSEIVYDRLPDHRMMPNPVDAAFAAFGNNQALSLEPDITAFASLPGALSRMRVLVDSHDQKFWESNFYNLWLSSLRALSPAADLTGDVAKKLPRVATTEAWGRRLLNAQLGSWAELRHDTLLYAKQSYTGIPGCEFPDAYVDPYPAFFAALRKYAEQGALLAPAAGPDIGAQLSSYFGVLRTAASTLEQMAQEELDGVPFTADQMAFINDAVRIDEESVVCTTIDVPNGWYAKLFYNPDASIKFDPTIADVHTQPADEGGNPVGKILHVGTGMPRLMVATIDTCAGGPRAYTGVVYAYHEETTGNFERLTDQAWAAKFSPGATRPAEVPWIQGLLAQ